MNMTEFDALYARAAERIVDRHRRLTHLQKRGGRNKGAHTQQVRHDWLRLSVHKQVRVDTLMPKSWRHKLPEVAKLAMDGEIDLIIDDQLVLVGRAK